MCGIIAVIGVLCLLIAWRDKENQKNWETKLAGWLCVLWALVPGLHYGYCLVKPDVQVFQGTFESEQRNSRVAPPLPLTMEYDFRDAFGNVHCFYLDVLSEKEIFLNDLEEGRTYTVYYEDRTDIILGIE